MPAGVVSGEAQFFGLDSGIRPPVRRRDAPTRWAGACFEFDGLETALIDRCDVSGKINWQIGEAAGRGYDMVKNIDEMQQFGKENMDATMKSFGVLSKSMQAIAVEVADYSKKVFEQGTAATEKLIGAKSLEKAVEVQSDFVKTYYEGFVAEATKIGELYTALAKEAYKPFESQFGKIASVK
jgi:hypothetical protein